MDAAGMRVVEQIADLGLDWIQKMTGCPPEDAARQRDALWFDALTCYQAHGGYASVDAAVRAYLGERQHGGRE